MDILQDNIPETNDNPFLENKNSNKNCIDTNGVVIQLLSYIYKYMKALIITNTSIDIPTNYAFTLQILSSIVSIEPFKRY